MAKKGDLSWKKTIIQRLKERNKQETQAFIALVEAHNKLFESVSSLKSKNVQLRVDSERLKEENLNLQIKVDSGGGGGGGTGHQELEKKLLQQQVELTEMHRKRGENAQQIIDLTNELKERDKTIQLKDAKLADSAAIEISLKQEIKHLESTIQEVELTNQTLKDEHQALGMAFTSLEEKFRKNAEEHNELMARWLRMKHQEADKINKENDRFYSYKQEQLQKELREAAKEPMPIQPLPEGAVLAPPICLTASLPTKAQCTVDAHEGEVNAVQWNPTGAFFATGGSDRKVKLWQYHSGGDARSIGVLQGCNAGITSIEFDAEGSHILCGSNDHASRIWSLSDHRLRHTLTGHSNKVLAAKFLGDANRVVSGCHDRTIKIWDLHSKACVKTIFAGSSCNDLVTLHGTNIISGHFDRRLRFWDSRSENTTNEIQFQGRIASLDLSPDRMSLLVCSRDDTLKIVDLRMNQVSQTLCADNFRVAFDYSRAVFSPDGSYAMAGSGDGTMFIWDVQKGKVERTLKEHSHAIIACAWHPQGQSVVTAEKQKKVIVWSDIY